MHYQRNAALRLQVDVRRAVPLLQQAVQSDHIATSCRVDQQFSQRRHLSWGTKRHSNREQLHPVMNIQEQMKRNTSHPPGADSTGHLFHGGARLMCTHCNSGVYRSSTFRVPAERPPGLQVVQVYTTHSLNFAQGVSNHNCTRRDCQLPVTIILAHCPL